MTPQDQNALVEAIIQAGLDARQLRSASRAGTAFDPRVELPLDIPLRELIERLLEALSQRGQVEAFLLELLKGQKSGSPLETVSQSLFPDIAHSLLDRAQKAESVLGRVVRSGLPTQEIQQLAEQISELTAFKLLHDFLHKLQASSGQFLFKNALLVSFDSDAVKAIRLTADAIRIGCGRARLLANQLTNEDRNREALAWIGNLEKEASAILASPDGEDTGAILANVLELRRIIRNQPIRLNEALSERVETLPLQDLIASLKGADPQGSDEDIVVAWEFLQTLHTQLRGGVALHKRWQHADRQMFLIEDLLLFSTELRIGNTQLRSLQVMWEGAKADILSLISSDTAALQLQAIVDEVDNALASREMDRLRAAYFRVRSDSLAVFVRVDNDVKDTCVAADAVGKSLVRTLS